ncbi:protein OPI10 homolog [Lycorma delicatula]|uniref:protein OPI10 homolog n=1 Tax=Lycorma delicatula TaxID=130591 RepID=UPI003F517818
MFALLVSGRLVQTDFQQVGEKQFLITIPDADDINHVAVFMTGTIPFPEGVAGLVYFSWPDPNAPPNWQPLGFISNTKPSAIFKISNLKTKTEKELESSGFLGFDQRKISHFAQIGISVEANEIVAQQTDLLVKQSNNQSTFMHFSKKMLENFLNFASSFAITQAQMVPNPTETYFPLSSLQTWYQNFERRLEINPYFWRT